MLKWIESGDNKFCMDCFDNKHAKVSLPVCLSACLSVCLSACLPLYLCLSVCLPLPLCLSVCHVRTKYVCTHVCMTECMYVCMYVCTYVYRTYTYVYIYIYIYIYTWQFTLSIMYLCIYACVCLSVCAVEIIKYYVICIKIFTGSLLISVFFPYVSSFAPAAKQSSGPRLLTTTAAPTTLSASPASTAANHWRE